MPLNPWKVEGHEQYYVDDIGNVSAVFSEFTGAMNNSTKTSEDGRLVLVTGESGCGKTAMCNWCAWHVRTSLQKAGLVGVVIDLRQCLLGREALTSDARFALITKELQVGLFTSAALNTSAMDMLQQLPDSTSGYSGLASAIRDDLVAIVLLPPLEIAADVIRFGTLARPKMWFVTEFPLYSTHSDEELGKIVSVLKRSAPPIVLRMEGLRPGDVSRFIQKRFDDHSKVGSFPRMSSEAVTKIKKWCLTVAQLQSVLHGVYEYRLHSGLGYDNSIKIRAVDIADYMIEEFQSSRRGHA